MTNNELQDVLCVAAKECEEGEIASWHCGDGAEAGGDGGSHKWQSREHIEEKPAALNISSTYEFGIHYQCAAIVVSLDCTGKKVNGDGDRECAMAMEMEMDIMSMSENMFNTVRKLTNTSRIKIRSVK